MKKISPYNRSMRLFDFLFKGKPLEMDTEERDRWVGTVESSEARGVKERANVKVILGEDE